MANLIPKICGKNEIIVPESDCSECDRLEARIVLLEGRATALESRATALEARVTALEDCCSEVRTALGNKVDKEAGKGLSTNDYTTTEKTKLAGIETGAQRNVQADWNETDTASDAYIKNKPDGWTKDGILDTLGYKEIVLEMTATDGTVVTNTVLVKR